jgi:hypothetical protein
VAGVDGGSGGSLEAASMHCTMIAMVACIGCQIKTTGACLGGGMVWGWGCRGGGLRASPRAFLKLSLNQN